MCSRYTLISPPEAVRCLFHCDEGEESFPPRYNIAPTDPVLIIRNSERGTRELVLVRWGLIPSWVKDPGDFSTLINARAETAAEKPSFRALLRHRRCLVPTDGYYEWTGRPGAKQPHLIRLRAEGAFALAGLWEHWLGMDGSEIQTMAIVTTPASADVAHLHDRMPAIIEPGDYDRWLDCKSGTADFVMDFLQPTRSGLLETLAVNPRLNNPRAEGPDLIEPAHPAHR